jgi:hypothetical protein
MSEAYWDREGDGEAELYEIRIEGHLDAKWVLWFDGLNVTLEAGGATQLSGWIADQAALHGVLRKVRDLGMPLIAVTRVRSSQDGATGGEDG